MDAEELYKKVLQHRDDELQTEKNKGTPARISKIYQRALDMYDKAKEIGGARRIQFAVSNLEGLYNK
tara:strand:- start:141 stop:341 length:201 start_codon:yes stop_codon:yes gene_type:complete